MRKKISLLLFILPFCIQAQEVIVDEKVPLGPEETAGPNQKIHRYLHFGFGMITGAPEGPGGAIQYGKSYAYDFGVGLKYKLSGILSTGAELFFRQDRFNLENGYYSSTNKSKEILRLHQPGLLAFVRINFDPARGNRLGNYLDLAYWSTYISGGAHIVHYNNTSALYSDRTVVKHKDLNILSDFTHGPELRIGIGHFILFGRYRMERLLKTSYEDLPQFTFGLRIAS